MKKHIEYLDGLKVIMAVLITLLHYALAFFPNGFIGYGAGEIANKDAFVINALPWSLFKNTSIQLYVLFAVIAFVIATSYFNSQNAQHTLQKQAVKRYFRFCLPVLFSEIICYFGQKVDLFDYEKLYQVAESSWVLAIKHVEVTFPQLLVNSLVRVYFEIITPEVWTVLWCMKIIFFGSLMTYAILALFGSSTKRWGVYLILFAVGCLYQDYLVILAGIICAEDYCHRQIDEQQNWGIIILAIGLAIGSIPSNFLPAGITLSFSYAVGSLLILLGIRRCAVIKRLLAAKRLAVMGKYIFSLILVHCMVMLSLSITLYQSFLQMTDNSVMSFWLMMLPSGAVIALLTFAFYHCFEKPSMAIADKVAQWYFQGQESIK